MQRPIVLLASNDPELERVAIEAVLSTCHGIRVVRSLEEASSTLSAGTSDIALAIVDLDFHGQGRTLLTVLGTCEPEFPILVVAETVITKDTLRLVSETAVEWLRKPVDVAELRDYVSEICRTNESKSHPSKGSSLEAAGTV